MTPIGIKKENLTSFLKRFKHQSHIIKHKICNDQSWLYSMCFFRIQTTFILADIPEITPSTSPQLPRWIYIQLKCSTYIYVCGFKIQTQQNVQHQNID